MLHRVPPGTVIDVPKRVGVCPECGGPLVFEPYEWETNTGKPMLGHTLCTRDETFEAVYCESEHQYRMMDWVSVDTRVERWAARNYRIKHAAPAAPPRNQNTTEGE